MFSVPSRFFSFKYLRGYRAAGTYSTLLVTIFSSGTFLDSPVAWSAPLVVAPLSKALSFVPAQASTAAYKLGVEDVLEIRMTNHPQFDRTVTVRPDGKITFPRVGDVQVTGLTTTQLAARLKTQLERTLNNVRIEVEVKTARPRSTARIIGAVKAPSAYSIKPDWRVLDLIAAAGGLGAKPARVSGRIIREGNIIPLDVATAMAQPNSTANFALQPDDLLVLDESTVPNQVTVSGSVGTPGPYDLEEGLTLTKLLARAGGTTQGAALKRAQVLRQGVPIEIDISASQLQNPTSSASLFVLQMGDVLVVPENNQHYGVLGQVVKPAYYPLPEGNQDATLLKLLASSGGALPDGDLKNATITRTVDGKPQVTTVDLSAIQQGRAPDTQTLQDGDVLFVPRKTDQVHVLGQIGKPGAYPLTDNMTLLSLISEAGSSTTETGLAKAYVLRDGKQIPLDLYGALNEGNVDPNVSQFELQSGDVLVIPDASAQVTISGEVARPGTFKLDDRSTVPSLLAQAGDVTESAALSKAYVLRNGERLPLSLASASVDGTPTTEAENFRFQAGDVLVVPENKVKYAVMGQVARPGQYPYPEKAGAATVSNALTEAGGPLLRGGEGSANLKQANIIRVVNNQPTVIPTDLSGLFQKNAQVDNVVLQPGDILYIPPKKAGFNIRDVFGPLSALSFFLR